MATLKKALLSLKQGMEALLEKTAEMEEMLNAVESVLFSGRPRPSGKAKVERKPRRKKPLDEKPMRKSATDAVLDVILSSRNGATTTQIKEKIGLDEKQIWNIINRGKSMGKIKSAKRGTYVKA